MNKRNLIHHGDNEINASELTRQVRWGDPRTYKWLSTTQVWSWGNGRCDAIVVMTGSVGNATAYVVIRMGKRVEVVEGSLNSAMSAFGFDPKRYRIVTKTMLAEERAARKAAA